MSALNFRKPMSRDMMGIFAEAGLYLCEFPGRALSPGDTWLGSTTATGGCTSGQYKFVGFRTLKGREVADFEITKISMAQATQVDPMRLVVDVKTGIPVTVEYRVKGNSSGRVSRFLQTWDGFGKA